MSHYFKATHSFFILNRTYCGNHLEATQSFFSLTLILCPTTLIFYYNLKYFIIT